MAGGLLRKRDGHHARVGFVELFFDLVFVFAITQISHTLLAHLTWLGALQAAILLGAVWWAWIDTGWITNWLDPERPLVRVMLFGLMGAGLVLSTSLPEAFGEKGLVFAVAFAGLQIGRGLFTLWAVRGDPILKPNFQRIVVWASVGGAVWIAGGLAEGQERLLLWLLALALEFLGPVTAFWCPGLGKGSARDWNVEGAHIAEGRPVRHHLPGRVDHHHRRDLRRTGVDHPDGAGLPQRLPRHGGHVVAVLQRQARGGV